MKYKVISIRGSRGGTSGGELRESRVGALTCLLGTICPRTRRSYIFTRTKGRRRTHRVTRACSGL